MFFVVISWVIFSLNTFDYRDHYLYQMFNFKHASLYDGETIYLLKNNAVLLILCVIFSLGIINKKHFEQRKFIKMVIYLIMFILSICFLVGDTYNPFLYFRF